MAQVQQYFLRAAAATVIIGLLAPQLSARKFFSDDPLRQDPRPLPVKKPIARDINEYFDFFQNTFFEPGKDQREEHRIPPSADINTLGEVPDSAWFTNRLGAKPMTLAELVRGPGESHRPAPGPWTVLSSKNEGIMPGMIVQDARGQVFFLKFDPPAHPEMSSAADVIGSKFLYDLGYNVPENHIAHFTAEQLVLTPKSTIKLHEKKRRMNQRDLADILALCPRERDGRYRATASFKIPGELIGPFRFYDTREDDPNDIVPHEDRRELRGLYVFAEWLNHTDAKSLNTLDAVVSEGVPHIRHYLLDFGASLGSDSWEPKSPRAGNEYLFDWKPAYTSFLTLGLRVPAWQRVRYPHVPEVGHFESTIFNPYTWKTNYPNPAFDRRLPDDCFWAARKLMALSAEAIRAVVETGEYSDPRAVDSIARTLIARRDKIGRAYFHDVLPLDGFRVRNGRLEFEDLAVQYGFAPARQYQARWSRFDNEREVSTPIYGATGFALPPEVSGAPEGSYFSVEIRSAEPAKTVTVYLRTTSAGPEVAGLERHWARPHPAAGQAAD